VNRIALDGRVSRIAANLRPSPIRELLKLTRRPGMISFAGGNPDPAIFPVAEFAQASGS
jgi:2-aminoadipate transaminase